MQEEKKERIQNRLVALLVVLTIGVLIAAGFLIYNMQFKSIEDIEIGFNDNKQLTEEEDKKQPYVNEVHYTGGIGYPVVYSFPFNKDTGNYISNKELYQYEMEEKNHKMINLAKDYVKATLGYSYKEIQDNPKEWENRIKSLLHSYAFYEAYFLDEEQTYYGDMSSDDFIAELEDYLISIEWNGEIKYYTDPSLVFQDGYYYIRGVLQYTNYSDYNCEIPQDEFEANKWIYAPIIPKGESKDFCFEVLLSRDSDKIDNYKVVGFSPLFLEIEKDKIMKSYNTGLVPSMTSMIIEDH